MQQNERVDPTEVKMVPTALHYGLIGGLLTIVVSLVFYVLDLIDLSNPNNLAGWLSRILNWGVLVGAIVLAIKSHRDDDLGGYITMGRGFSTGTLTALILGLIGMVWAYVFFAFIDPGMIDDIRSLQIAAMEDRGMSEEAMEQSRGMRELFTSPAAISGMAMIGTLLFGLVISVIAGAVLKKVDPMYE